MKPLFLSLLILLTGIASAQTNGRDFLPDAKLRTKVQVKATTLQRQGEKYNLEFLDQHIRKNKVVLLGEGHWQREINQLLTAIVLHANTIDQYRFLVLEVPFSATAHVNAFINADDAHAQQYLEIIKPYFKSKENAEMLNALRGWNMQHPGKKITVGCSDIEQGIGFALKQVFDVYFKAVGEDQLIPKVKAAGLTPEVISYMEQVVNSSPDGTFVKDMPLLNKVFLQQALTSIKATYEASKIEEVKGYAGYLEARIHQIIKNLTDDAIFGKQLRTGKTIMWMGANHAKIPYNAQDNKTRKMEGLYLSTVFPATKGKVFSLRADNFAFAIPAEYYTTESYTAGTESFQSLVNLYKQDQPAYSAGRYRVLDQLTPLSTALTVKSQAAGNHPVYLYRSALAAAAKQQPSLKKDEKWQEYMFHDLVIAIPGTMMYTY